MPTPTATPPGSLAIPQGRTALDRATAWATLPDDELRRRAAAAANRRDGDELWALTEAYLTVRGARGTRISRYTIRNYRRGVLDLLDAWPHVNLLRPHRDDAQLWVRTMERALKPGTIRVKIAAASALYRALRWSGATAEAPFADVRAPWDPDATWEKRREYTREHLDRLLAIAAPLDAAIILLGAHAGLRISEVASLRWRDVDALGGELRVFGKGRKVSTVVLTPALTAALLRLKPGAPEGGVIPFGVDRIRGRFRDLCKRAGVPYKGRAFHGLRHSAGTLLLEQSGDISMVADHLRHKSIETARGYAKRQRVKLVEALGQM